MSVSSENGIPHPDFSKRTRIIDDNEEPRFLLQGCGFDSYQDLVFLIAIIAKSSDTTFPPEIVRNISNFFTTKHLDSSKTRALRCSSTSGQHSLDQCLVDTENSWWISARGSLRNGASRIEINDALRVEMCTFCSNYIYSTIQFHRTRRGVRRI
jgi:hypothetical protein